MSSTLFISPYIPHHSREFLPIPRVPCAKLTFKGNDLVDAIKRAKAGLSWDLQWGRDKEPVFVLCSWGTFKGWEDTHFTVGEAIEQLETQFEVKFERIPVITHYRRIWYFKGKGQEQTSLL